MQGRTPHLHATRMHSCRAVLKFSQSRLQHRRSQLQHLSVRAAHRDVGTGYFEYFDVRGAFEGGHWRRLRLARAARRAVLRTISSLENTQCVALGCDDVTVDLLLLRLSENTFYCKRTHSIVREHIL